MSPNEKILTFAAIVIALALLVTIFIIVKLLTRKSEVCGDFIIDHHHTYTCVLTVGHRGKHADITWADYTDPIDRVWYTWPNEHERDYGPFEGRDGVPR